MRRLRGITNSWVVNGMVKSGRVCGVRWWRWVCTNGDQELGRQRQKRMCKGDRVRSSLEGPPASAVSLQDQETLPAPPWHPLAQETKGQLSTLSSLPLGLGEKPQSPWWELVLLLPSILVAALLALPRCYRFGAEWRQLPTAGLGWAGLLIVGGIMGGSHCQFPLLAIQRPAASPSPPMT